jgi:3-oxoacyl-[acyl-carrier-protein] synthase III
VRWDRLFIDKTAVDLPAAVLIADAVKDGRYPESRADNGCTAVTVAAPDALAVDFALRAARRALQISRHVPDEIALLTFTGPFQSPLTEPMWSPASYIQRELGIGTRCRSEEIGQGTSGTWAAVEHALSWLGTHAVHDHPAPNPGALITAAHAWPLDPLMLDTDIPPGSGGAALVISPYDGWAQFMSIATRSDPALPGSRPDDLPFPRLTTEQWERHAALLRDTVTAALEQARVKLDQVDRVVLPHLSAQALGHYLPIIGVTVNQTTWTGPGRRIGHMPAVDTIVGLHHLRVSRTTRRGNVFLFLSVGSGTMTAGVLRQVSK